MKAIKKIAIAIFIVSSLLIGCHFLFSRSGENNGVEYTWEYRGTPGLVEGHVTSTSGQIQASYKTVWIQTDSGESEARISDDGNFRIISGANNISEIGVGDSSLKRYISCSKGVYFNIRIK